MKVMGSKKSFERNRWGWEENFCLTMEVLEEKLNFLTVIKVNHQKVSASFGLLFFNS